MGRHCFIFPLLNIQDAEGAETEFILFSVERTKNNKLKSCGIQIAAGQYMIFRHFDHPDEIGIDIIPFLPSLPCGMRSLFLWGQQKM